MKRIACCLWLVGIVAIASSQIDPKRIEPGKQLGKLNIGDLMEDMKWLKGADYRDTQTGREWLTWDAKKADPRNGNIINSLDVFASMNDAGKYQIRLIRSTSPTFATKDKVKVGSTFQTIKQKFSKLAKLASYKSPQFSAKVAVYDDAAAGVAFEFKTSSDGTVSNDDKCVSIWVHEPSADIIQIAAPVQYLTDKPALRKAAKHKKSSSSGGAAKSSVG